MFAFRTDVLSYFAAVQMMNTFYIKISTKFSDDTTSFLLHFRVKLLAVSSTRSLSSVLFMFDTFYLVKFHSHLNPVIEKWFKYQFSWWRERFSSICSNIKRTSEHRIDVTANIRPVNVQCHRCRRVRTIHSVHASITTRTLYKKKVQNIPKMEDESEWFIAHDLLDSKIDCCCWCNRCFQSNFDVWSVNSGAKIISVRLRY